MKFENSIWVLIVAASLIATCTAQSNDSGCAVHLQDGSNAKNMTFNNLRDVRYCEISFICQPGAGGASMYNTQDLNNKGTHKDTCPEALWNNISETAMAAQYQVPNVWKNGPRFWVADSITIPVGTELDFNGLKARWFAYPSYPPNIQSLGITAGSYIITKVQRNSQIRLNKGREAFILTDPSGTPYVMQAAAKIVDQNLTYKDLMTLDKKLQLPTGWKYSVKVLPQDLTIVPFSNGTAVITQDSLGNSYDACYTETCNYIP